MALSLKQSLVNRAVCSRHHENPVIPGFSRAQARHAAAAPQTSTTSKRDVSMKFVQAFLGGTVGRKFMSQLSTMLGHNDEKTKAARLAVLERFYTRLDRTTTEDLMTPGFRAYEEGSTSGKYYARGDWLGLVYGAVLPAAPDFSWGWASTGEVDGGGFMVATVTVSGHHTGEPFALPGMPPVPPSGRHFCLAEEVHMVRLEGGKVAEIKILPSRGAGPRALYAALAGAPLPPADAAPSTPPL